MVHKGLKIWEPKILSRTEEKRKKKNNAHFSKHLKDRLLRVGLQSGLQVGEMIAILINITAG